MGRICFDLELKTTPSGVPVLSTRLAVDRNYRAQGEERKTDFINIVAWRSNAEFIAKYFSKGRLILVDGELQTRQYVDKNNMTRDVVEVVVNSAHFTGERAGTAGGISQLPPPPDQEPPGRRYGGNSYGSAPSAYGGDGGYGGYSGGAAGDPYGSAAPAASVGGASSAHAASDPFSSPASAGAAGAADFGGVAPSGGDDDDYPF